MNAKETLKIFHSFLQNLYEFLRVLSGLRGEKSFFSEAECEIVFLRELRESKIEADALQ
jgi:hypothetical protein